jgi:hypothetical protein
MELMLAAEVERLIEGNFSRETQENCFSSFRVAVGEERFSLDVLDLEYIRTPYLLHYPCI